MKLVIVLSAIVAVALAQGADKDAVITKYSSDNIGVEGYQYGYETSNGIAANEHGEVINAGSENEAIKVQGSYSYTGKDNEKIQVVYYADESGFHAEGDHIPKA